MNDLGQVITRLCIGWLVGLAFVYFLGGDWGRFGELLTQPWILVPAAWLLLAACLHKKEPESEVQDEYLKWWLKNRRSQ
ncbi:MAG: hypothetical protein ACM3US_00030 [Sphingomonadaceae bacterium]